MHSYYHLTGKKDGKIRDKRGDDVINFEHYLSQFKYNVKYIGHFLNEFFKKINFFGLPCHVSR
ncbi:hypothetical protein BH23THE1_BH23THE1_32610 [soil metagenome]